MRIEAQMRDHTENGFGFVVGERAGTLYIVTAYHVVVDPQDIGGAPPAVIKVEFFDHQGEMVAAKLLGTHDAERDLAVLIVASPTAFRWTDACVGREPSADEAADVWLVGRSQKWDVPAVSGKVSAVSDGRIDVDGLPVRPGSSGAPLVAASGIVGMILRDSAESAQALSLGVIREKFRQWNHPWDLRAAAAAPPATGEPPPRHPPKVIHSEELHFGTSVDVLESSQDHITLALLASRMEREPELYALVIGYTDDRENTGPYADLAARRAIAVRDFLVGPGINPSRIRTEARGVREPVGDNATAAGRAQNRRVVIKLMLLD